MHYWRTTRCGPSCAAERGQCCQTAPDSTHARTDVGSGCQQQPLAHHPMATEELLDVRQAGRAGAGSIAHYLNSTARRCGSSCHRAYGVSSRPAQETACSRRPNPELQRLSRLLLSLFLHWPCGKGEPWPPWIGATSLTQIWYAIVGSRFMSLLVIGLLIWSLTHIDG